MEAEKILVIAMAIMLILAVTALIAHVQAVDKHSNYYKNCIKMTDKRVRSIECPDVFPKSESSFIPGG